jgi:MFS family permease
MGSLVGANVAARLTARFGLRTIMLVGMLLVTGGLVMLATLSVTSGFVPVALAFALVGSGMGLVTVPASNAIVGTLPADRVGAGSGLRAMVQLLGGTMGVAIVGSLASGVYRSDIQSALEGPLRDVPAASRPALGSQIGNAASVAAKLPRGLGQATREAADQAFVNGLHLSALVGVGIMIVALLSAAVYVPSRVTSTEDLEENVAVHL